MKHLTNNDWVELLYNDEPNDRDSHWRAHIAECEICRTEQERWLRLQKQLNQWELPPSTKIARVSWRSPGWALAATLLIGLSFLFGYMSGMQRPDSEAMLAVLRAEIQPELERMTAEVGGSRDTAGITQADLHQLKSEFQRQLVQQSQQTKAAIAVLEKESQRAVRKIQTELETVALVGERRYVFSQNQLHALGITTATLPVHFTAQPTNY